MRGELNRSARGKRVNTGKDKGTDRRNRDQGNERTVNEDEGDANAAPAPPLPAIIEVRGVPGASYAEALKKLKENVSRKRHGVRKVALRATPKGTALITIKGEGCREKAKSLAKEMREVLRREGMVLCPRRMSEVEVAGFDPSTSANELKALTSAGGFPMGDLSLGMIRKTRGGAGRV